MKYILNKNLIKATRLSLLLTQKEFGQILGVKYETVCRYENGKSKPTIRVQRKLKSIIKRLDESNEIHR